MSEQGDLETPLPWPSLWRKLSWGDRALEKNIDISIDRIQTRHCLLDLNSWLMFSAGAPTKAHQGQKGSGWAEGASTEPARHLQASKHPHWKPGAPALCWRPFHVTHSSSSALLTSGPVTDSWYCEYCDSQEWHLQSVFVATETVTHTHLQPKCLQCAEPQQQRRKATFGSLWDRVRGRKSQFSISYFLDPNCVRSSVCCFLYFFKGWWLIFFFLSIYICQIDVPQEKVHSCFEI